MKAISIPTPIKTTHSLGFMSGHISIPKDFDRMGSKEIEQLFGNYDR